MSAHAVGSAMALFFPVGFIPSSPVLQSKGANHKAKKSIGGMKNAEQAIHEGRTSEIDEQGQKPLQVHKPWKSTSPNQQEIPPARRTVLPPRQRGLGEVQRKKGQEDQAAAAETQEAGETQAAPTHAGLQGQKVVNHSKNREKNGVVFEADYMLFKVLEGFWALLR